jgi:hypothetical protein
MDGSTMSASHKTAHAAPFFARIYEFAVDRLIGERLDWSEGRQRFRSTGLGFVTSLARSGGNLTGLHG